MARFAPLATIALLAAGLGGCASITEQRGYIVDNYLVQSVQPGVDNRRSVEETLGRPSFTSQFGDQTWYYVSSTTERAPFGTPQIDQHMTLAVHFDDAGNVLRVTRAGKDQIAKIDPDGDETPTLGREKGFFEELFGNIGRVGVPGGGAPGGQ